MGNRGLEASSSLTGSPGAGNVVAPHLAAVSPSPAALTQVRFNKREMRRMRKSDINYPVIPNPTGWTPAGWHASWDQRFKVRMGEGCL
jgi:hypothetical protein